VVSLDNVLPQGIYVVNQTATTELLFITRLVHWLIKSDNTMTAACPDVTTEHAQNTNTQSRCYPILCYLRGSWYGFSSYFKYSDYFIFQNLKSAPTLN